MMARAVVNARKGMLAVNPNPRVGAVVVKDKKIVGQGWHKLYGKEHAEVIALREAGSLAKGSELYVTLEPCNHWGKTGPCTEVIINSGVKRVVVSRLDSNKDVPGAGAEKLRANGIVVDVGCLEEEVSFLNRAWEHYVLKKIPYVTIEILLSLDARVEKRTVTPNINQEKSATYDFIIDENSLSFYDKKKSAFVKQSGVVDFEKVMTAQSSQHILVRNLELAKQLISAGKVNELKLVYSNSFVGNKETKAITDLGFNTQTPLQLLKSKKIENTAVVLYKIN